MTHLRWRQIYAALAAGTAFLTVLPAGPAKIAVRRDSVIDPAALTFAEGRFGTAINGQTFQVPAITSWNGWQYATWFDGQRRLCVGRRALPDGAWQTFAFADYRITHTDVHNVAVIGVCPLDGTIHLSFDHHGHPLRYRVSRAGVATAPERHAWEPGLFGPTTSELAAGQKILHVTYPAFVPTPDGRLLLFYRIGASGNGTSCLADYDPRQGGWAVRGPFIGPEGDFRGSLTRNAYHNGFDFDPAGGGRLHTTWVWREGLDNSKPEGGLLNCHDLMYAWSEDSGRTWRNNSGDTIGRAGAASMHVASAGVTVHEVAYKWGAMNQVTQTVDAQGRVHVVLWHQPPDAPAGSRDMNSWRYFHYWRERDGRWHRRQLPFVGRKPSVHAGPRGDLWLVFNRGESAAYHGRDPGGRLHVATASAGGAAWPDWRIAWASDTRFIGEPRVDATRWAEADVLSVYVQEQPAKPGEPSALHAIDFQIGR